MQALPYGRQDVTDDDIQRVVSVLQSSHLTQGDVTVQFEDAVAEYCGASFGVSFNSATSALHTGCLALGLGNGDWLWTSAVSFVASANCGLYCGAQIDLVDIDFETRNMSIDSLEAKLATAKLQGKLPKIVVVVHLAGLPMDMARIAALSDEYGFSVIEDASHAIGSSYGVDRVGSCAFSQITVLSFHPVKIITSGEGGMALTNDPVLAERLRMIMSHGITKETAKFEQDTHGPWYYEQQMLGYNYRMTDIHAALGLSQLNRLDDYIGRRNEIADLYRERLAGLPLILPTTPTGLLSAFHLFIVSLSERAGDCDVYDLFIRFRKEMVFVQKHYIPIFMQPYYKAMKHLSAHDFPNSTRYYKQSLSIPIFPAMQNQDVERVCDVIYRYFR